MRDLNPFAQAALAFVVLFCLVTATTFVIDVGVRHEAFTLDLAFALGVSAGGAVLLLVKELTDDKS